MQLPQTFGDQDAYRVISVLGRGGFATVYKAYRASLDRYVAIKVLHPMAGQDEAGLQRFRREAQSAARVSGHPNIVTIYDYGEQGGQPYVVLEYIEGETLEQRLERPISAAEIDRIVQGIAAALDHAHAHRLVHRDVKPSNVLLSDDGRLVLSDFGIAKVLDATTALTAQATAIGTPEYMAPEQVLGEEVDARTDIYALGIVIYRMFAGRPPFQGRMITILHKHVYDPPPPLVNPDRPVAPAVEEVVRIALAKDRAERYASAGELAAALSRALQPTIRLERGRAALDAGDLVQAVQLAAELLADDPNDEQARELHQEALRRAHGEVAGLLEAGQWRAALADIEWLREAGAPGVEELARRAEELRIAEEARIDAERRQAEEERLRREREAREQAEREQAERERRERDARERAEQEARARAERERLEREAGQRQEREARERAAREERERAEREAATRAERLRPPVPAGPVTSDDTWVGTPESPAVGARVARPATAERPGSRVPRGLWLGAAGLVLVLGGALVGLSTLSPVAPEASIQATAPPRPTVAPTGPPTAGAVAAATPTPASTPTTAPAVGAAAPTATAVMAAAKSTAPPAATPTAPPVVPKPTDAPPTAVPKPTAGPTAAPLPPRVTLRDGVEMALVSAGQFTIGNDADDLAGPAHVLELPAFYVDQVEVTNARFAAFVEQARYQSQGDWRYYADPKNFNPAHFDAERGQHPVVNVTWADADAYCRWAGKRLPNEAEWEKAARGTDGRRWPWGNEPHPEYVNVELGDETGPEPDTARVGKFSQGASPYGVLDLIGNVWEWTSSPFTKYPLELAKLIEPAPSATDPRVTRGASFTSLPGSIEVTRRLAEPPSTARKDLGFRCVTSAAEAMGR